MKVIEVYEGVSHRENFKVPPFRNVIDISFALGQRYREQNIDVLQLLVKFFLSPLYGEQIRKSIEEGFACKSEYWMMTVYDERYKNYWKMSHGNYIVKMIHDKGLEDELKKRNTSFQFTLGCFWVIEQ